MADALQRLYNVELVLWGRSREYRYCLHGRLYRFASVKSISDPIMNAGPSGLIGISSRRAMASAVAPVQKNSVNIQHDRWLASRSKTLT